MKNKKRSSCIITYIFKIAACMIIFSAGMVMGTSNWKSSGSGNGTDDEKQGINFYGTLTTHQGQKDTVDHILIEGKHKDIVMYDAPVKHAQEIFNQKTKQTEIKLDENPITDFMKSKMDLNEVKHLKVPNPNTVWVYQKEKKYQRIEFICVEITTKENNTSQLYLLERKTHLSCNALDNGTQKKDVPLSAIDTLTIEGYSFILNENQAKKNRPAPCKKTVAPEK